MFTGNTKLRFTAVAMVASSVGHEVSMEYKRLTVKQQRFVQAYDGNGVAAARAAGYRGTDNTLAAVAKENLQKPHIVRAIREREERRQTMIIATREQRQQFWTQTMNDPDVPWKDRLRASELLGRSEGDFLERHEVKHTGIGERIERAMERLRKAQAETGSSQIM